eukprot:20023-Prorocentrum_minimum.AAC.2
MATADAMQRDGVGPGLARIHVDLPVDRVAHHAASDAPPSSDSPPLQMAMASTSLEGGAGPPSALKHVSLLRVAFSSASLASTSVMGRWPWTWLSRVRTFTVPIFASSSPTTRM